MNTDHSMKRTLPLSRKLTRGLQLNTSIPSASPFFTTTNNHSSQLLQSSWEYHNQQRDDNNTYQQIRACSTTTSINDTEDEHTTTKRPLLHLNTRRRGRFAPHHSLLLQNCHNNNNIHNNHNHSHNQLTQRRNFHATKRNEILPYVIVGGVVVYFFSKWIIDYRTAKDSGEYDDDEEEEEDYEEEDENGTFKRRGKRVIVNADGVAGLDLGSVYSRVGVALADEKETKDDEDDDDYDSDDDDGTPKHWYVRVVENAEGSRSTVSLVGLQPGEDEFLVGEKAKNLNGTNFWASHCLLGLKHGEEKTNLFSKHFKLKEDQLISGIGGTMQIVVDDDVTNTSGKGSPEMLTSKVIQHLTDLASFHIPSGKCSHVLIAVPNDVVDNEIACNSFDIAMKQAGVQSLGVERQSICAIHGIDQEIMESKTLTVDEKDWWHAGRKVAVIDVGRSVEASLIELQNGRDAKVLHVENGLPFVGGSSLDTIILDKLLYNFEKENKMVRRQMTI